MQLELFQIYDRPAIYRRNDDGETCIAWNREQGRFEEDVEALHLVLSGSSDVRRIDGDRARRLIARMLARSNGRTSAETALLDEFMAIEEEGARRRAALTDAENVRCFQIVDSVVSARLRDGSLGLNENEISLIF